MRRQFHLRFTEEAWDLIRTEAEEQDVTMAEFVRSASVAYAIFLQARRGDMVSMQAVDAIIERLRRSE